MRIHACAAAVASVATFALAPLATAHGTWWRADADRVQSFAEVQSASSEAPAFHTGDGSIYDSSRGLASTTRIAVTPRLPSSATYEQRSMNGPSTMHGGSARQIDQAAQLDVDPAGEVSSGSVLPDRPGATADRRPGATVDRYGAPMK